MFALLVTTVTIWHSATACLPGPFGLGFAPGFNGGYMGGLGGIPPPYAGGLGPRPMGPMGPFRSEQHGTAQRDNGPRISAQMDEIQSISALNCPGFTEENRCKWGNVNDEELDWSTVGRTPEADRWFASLGVHNYPDITAASLVSTPRNGWEGGRLVSDYLPCVGEGLKITATAWRTKDAPQMGEPKLQVCTRNQGEERMPLVNCNDFDIRNGVPITVAVPAATDTYAPAQIVFNGYNFMTPMGGAIFLQDVVVEGSLSCNGENLDSHPMLIDENAVRPPMEGTNGLAISPSQVNSGFASGVNRGQLRSPGDPVGPLKVMDGLSGLEPIDAAPRTPQFEERQSLSSLQNNGLGGSSNFAGGLDGNSINSASFNTAANSIGATPTLFESCLALSCNPSELSCKFWRSAGNNRWEIGSSNRVANPLTGIHLPPGSAQRFLVAPFLDSHINSYMLVSEPIDIPLLNEVYFCFYEYYATQGLSLKVCTDKMDCFYKKTTLAMGQSMQDNKQWNMRCAKLPVGNYELRVIAESSGDNKGEVGFLPIRLSRDPQGLDFVC